MTPPLADAVLVAPVNAPEAAELPSPFPQLQSGEVSAVLVPPIDDTTSGLPEVNAVVDNFDKLPELGIEVYEAQDKSSVLYNPTKVTEQELVKADEAGTLAQLAQPLIGGEAPAGAETAAALQTAPLAAASIPAGAPQLDESRLTTARVRNFSPKQVSPIQPKPLANAVGTRAI